MDNKAINKKAKIAEIVNIFKQKLQLKSSEMNERRWIAKLSTKKLKLQK